MKKQVLLSILVSIALLIVGCAGLQDSGSVSSESPLASAESSLDLLPDAPVSASGGEAASSGSAGPTPNEAPLGAKEETVATAASSEPEPEPPVEVSDPFGAAGQGDEDRSRAAAPPVVRYLSADDSNSMASPVVARKLIQSGRWVPPELIRTYEFLNYFDFHYEPPIGELLRVFAHMRRLDGDTFSLQVALRSQDRDYATLQPFNLTLLLDTSGSMAGAPIRLATEFVGAVTSLLPHHSVLSVVGVSRRPTVLLDGHVVDEATPKTLHDLLSQVAPNDVTDLDAGIQAAYELAFKHYDSGYLNRVLVLSDGAANSGVTALETISRSASDSDRQGIYLAGVGVGVGFNDRLMNAVTDRGRGAYIFLDSVEEIARILSPDRFVSIFDLALRDVRLKMTMPSGWEMVEFHGEQASASASDVVPQYLASGDQMIYHLTVAGPPDADSTQKFEFEAEYRPMRGAGEVANAAFTVNEMLGGSAEIVRGDAIVSFAEMLKRIRWPLHLHRDANLIEFDIAYRSVTAAYTRLGDPQLARVLRELDAYRETIENGENPNGSRDSERSDPASVLGIAQESLRDSRVTGVDPQVAIAAKNRLLQSTRLVPLEGSLFLVISTGPVGNSRPRAPARLMIDH